MAITAASSQSTLQTFGDAYETMFDASGASPTYAPASIIKVQCVANGLIVRVNGDDNNLVVIDAASSDYIRSIMPGGVKKLEGKNLTGGSNATGYWSRGVTV